MSWELLCSRGSRVAPGINSTIPYQQPGGALILFSALSLKVPQKSEVYPFQKKETQKRPQRMLGFTESGRWSLATARLQVQVQA